MDALVSRAEFEAGEGTKIIPRRSFGENKHHEVNWNVVHSQMSAAHISADARIPIHRYSPPPSPPPNERTTEAAPEEAAEEVQEAR